MVARLWLFDVRSVKLGIWVTYPVATIGGSRAETPGEAKSAGVLRTH